MRWQKIISGSGYKPLNDAFSGALKWLALFSVAANLLMLAVPLHMIQVYDRVLPAKGYETLFYLTLLVVVALGIFGLIEALRSVIAQKLSAKYELVAAPALLTGSFLSRADADAAGAMRQVGQVRQMLGSRNFVNVFDLPFAPVFLLLTFALHWVLGVMTLVGGLVLCAIAWLNNRALGDATDRASTHNNQALRFASVALRQNDDVRAMGMTGAMIDRWEADALAAIGENDRAASINAFWFGVTRFVRQTLQVLTLATGAYLVLNHQMSAGLIFAASLLSGRALQPIEQMIGGWRQWLGALEGHRSIGETVEKLQAGTPAEALRLPEPKGEVVVKALGYALSPLPGVKPILSDVSLMLKPGEIVAVIGPSGAGKSTLARLLAGALKPTSGEVRLDGFELDNWDAEQRGMAVGYLGQDIEFLDGTVAENIARFSSEASDAQIVDAARRANAHEFIATMPDGYRTRVGAGGVRLSGGQTQRLALARALFGNPAVIILDEPNAHLDSDGEAALLTALQDERARSRTILVVTQRTSLLQVADRVAVIRGGRLESIGPREQRPAPRPRYVAQVSDFRRSTEVAHADAG
ncbi:MAG: type I secretion system permease/ATPase [Devosia sp.]